MAGHRKRRALGLGDDVLGGGKEGVGGEEANS